MNFKKKGIFSRSVRSEEPATEEELQGVSLLFGAVRAAAKP